MRIKTREWLLDRFHSKIRKLDNGCWQWTGSLIQQGYGRIHANRQSWLAHRFSYELHVGPIPDGLQIDHLCRNRGCVNPAHLEAVTIRENLLRGETHAAVNAAKTHCKRGHPFAGDNLRFDAEGARVCHACRIERTRKRRAENPEHHRMLSRRNNKAFYERHPEKKAEYYRNQRKKLAS